MGITMQEATGRAKCRKCKQFIDRGEVDILSWAYQNEEHHHLACILKSCTREQIEKAMEQAMLMQV